MSDVGEAEQEKAVVQLSLPVDAVARLRELAAARDSSLEALLRFYIEQGMRPTTASLPDHCLQKTAYVLRKFIASEGKRAEILRALGAPIVTVFD